MYADTGCFQTEWYIRKSQTSNKMYIFFVFQLHYFQEGQNIILFFYLWIVMGFEVYYDPVLELE